MFESPKHVYSGGSIERKYWRSVLALNELLKVYSVHLFSIFLNNGRRGQVDCTCTTPVLGLHFRHFFRCSQCKECQLPNSVNYFECPTSKIFTQWDESIDVSSAKWWRQYQPSGRYLSCLSHPMRKLSI